MCIQELGEGEKNINIAGDEVPLFHQDSLCHQPSLVQRNSLRQFF